MTERPRFTPSSVDEFLPDQSLRQAPVSISQRGGTGPRLPEGVEFPDRPEWPVTLRHEELVLRPMRYRDAARWAEVRRRNREWTGPWDATAPTVSSGRPSVRPSGHAQMVRTANRLARSGQSLPLVVCIDEGWPENPSKPESLPLSGQVTVSNIVYGSARFASIGYWIDEAAAGRGLMPRAVALVADYCFQVLGLHRLEVNIRPENRKSLRVAHKLGLRNEGIRPRFLHIDGDWRDHICFSVLDEDVPEGLLNGLLRHDPRWSDGHHRQG